MILSLLASAALLPAQAQLFGPDALGGALLGGLIGGIAGGDCHGLSGEGAAIGAGIGLVAGALVGESRRYDYYDSPGYAYSSAPTVSLGYGYGHCGSSGYVYYSPNYYTAPGYYYRPARANYAVGGTLLGAASGALIGAGSHQAGEGAAIGAGAGLVLGSVAELATRKHERERAAAMTAQSQPAQQSPPAPVVQTPAHPATEPYHMTSRPTRNSTYTWTPRPQIADAPQVPDAPRF